MRSPVRSTAAVPVLTALAIAAAVTPAVTPAAAAARVLRRITAHKVSLTGHVEALSSTGQIGTPGVKDTDAGILDGTIAGEPAWAGALTQVGTWGQHLAITTKGTAFNADGALRFTITGRFGIGTTGELALTGTMRVTGGTGVYAGAHGTLKVAGTTVDSPTTSKLAFTLTGSLDFAGS